MNSKPCCWRAALLAAVLMLCTIAAAADYTARAAQLARSIAAITGSGTASISYRNLSSLPADQVDPVRRAIENELRSNGVRIGSAANTAAAEIRVTLSEDPQRYVWIAEVQQGNDVRIAMVAVERSLSTAIPARQSSMTLRKTLLWSQPARILDVAVLPTGSETIMLVLDPAGITLSKKIAATWTPQQTIAIPRDIAWPRDVRGRLVPGRDHLFDVYLPGTICASTGTGATLNLTCRQGDDPWPLSPGESAFFAPTRNFFTGVVNPPVGRQGSVAPFYSAASLPRTKLPLWVFARTDGTVHALDGTNDILVRSSGWGSDLAAVNSGCSSGNQLLVAGTADGTVPDNVRVFEIPDREPMEVTSPTEFSGPVTALWTAADAHTAVAVVHNLRTDHYDAFELALTCNQ